MQYDFNKSENLDVMVYPTGKLKMSKTDSEYVKKNRTINCPFSQRLTKKAPDLDSFVGKFYHSYNEKDNTQIT